MHGITQPLLYVHARKGAVFCSALTGQRSLLRHALDAVDAVVANLGPLPAPMAAMLFQNESQQEAFPVLMFTAALYCPKIGMVLAVEGDRNPLTAPLPDKSFGALEAILTDVGCTLGSSGIPSAVTPPILSDACPNIVFSFLFQKQCKHGVITANVRIKIPDSACSHAILLGFEVLSFFGKHQFQIHRCRSWKQF